MTSRLPFCPVLFLVVLSLFAGCRKNEPLRIGVSQCSSDDWREKMNEEMRLEAMLHPDVEIEIRSADDDSRKQIEDIRYFRDNGFDILIVAPNEAQPLTPVIGEIYDSGMPVIVFDRNISSDKYTERIGVDNIGLGRAAARYAVHLKGDTLRAVEIYGLPGSTPADDRHAGFSEVIDSLGLTLTASAPGNWHQQEAKDVADSLIKNFPQLNLIYAHNDRMAIGAAEAAENAGRNDIRIIGIDAAPEIGIRAVADSVIDATFLYPTEGHLIIREALKILKGQPHERTLMLPMASAVDKTNADIIALQNATINDESQRISELKNQLDNYWQRHSAQNSLLIAIIVILLLLFGVLFLVLRMFWSNRRHQETLTQQNRMLEAERDKQRELNIRLEEATQSKLVFFTNVSHDLRTPLTLIAEPVSQLREAKNLTEAQTNLIALADKNIKILNRLINQILDFRKFENNRLSLNLSEVDIAKAIREWTESFQSVARKRDITLTVNGDEAPLNIAVDAEKIERVFFNLLSNALKYSPDNSKITVAYGMKDANFEMSVTDTGEGISERDLGHIFDRFFQVDRVRPRGSGIGLSLAKAFIELHGGSITVESELNKGSEFTVVLPMRHVAEKAVEIKQDFGSEDVEAELGEVDTTAEFAEDKPLLLVIDDNRDIRELVSELMKEDYNILRAANGKEGIRKALKYVPDLIICDVMMPGIDGLEVCASLKKESPTSHIPVLMLTACSMDEQRVEGFESGADGYLSKPFSSAVLKAQAKSLIANRRRILENEDAAGKAAAEPKRVSGDDNRRAVLNPENKDRESEFYNRFVEIFDARMSDPDLNVEAIASEMGFERTQLYRKIKALTNYSPVELMRTLRLKRSRRLLTTTDLSISEIAYAVGFSTPAYFTKCYREMFDETPSETRSRY